ncbi:MAG: Gldg family protein [Planctomycetota bacterium]
MARKIPVSVTVAMWALGLVLAAAVLALAPMYLVDEARSAAEAGAGKTFRFFEPSHGWSREILAACHILFIGAMLCFALFPSGRRLAGRMTGASILLGLLEILLGAGSVWLLSEKAQFAPPQMTVVALGALLLLGGLGLNLDALARRLMSPKTPVVLIFGVAVLLAAAAFGLIGMLNVRHYERIDYTRAGRYSLPPATVELLSGLGEKVRISTLFFLEQPADETRRREVTDILGEYARISANIEVDHLDLRREGDVKPAKELEKRLKKKGIRLEKNAVFFECGSTGRAMAVAPHEMLEIIGPKRRAAAPANVPGERENEDAEEPAVRFLGDSVFHQALAVVTSRKPVKLYFVVGHGEKPRAVGPPSPLMRPDVRKQIVEIFSTRLLEQGLRRRYFHIETLDLDDADAAAGIPRDCDVLVIAGPWCAHVVQSWGPSGLRPFTGKQARVVGDYLERGGRALIMIDPTGAHYGRMIEPLLSMLKEYGIEVDVDNIVIDERIVKQSGPFGREIQQSEPSPLFFAALVEEYRRPGTNGDSAAELHPCVAALRGRPIAAVECAEINTAPVSGMRTSRLLVTGKKAWLQPRPRPGQDFREGDRGSQRRRTLAVAVEDEKTGRPVMVVLGSSNMFVQQMIRFGNVAYNEEFAHKALAWLSGSAGQLGVRPKPTEIAHGRTTASAIRTIRFIAVLVLPSIFILAGAVIRLGRMR